MKFSLKRPCRDCPFIVDTTMILQPGRMAGIAESLRDDHNVFPCHKTTNSTRGDDWDDAGDDERDSDGYVYDGNEQACMGALAFTLREHDMIPVLARIAVILGDLSIDTIRANLPAVEANEGWRTCR